MRSALVTMVAVLGSWFTAWRLSHALGLHADVVVLSTVLALTLSRTFARERPRRLWLRLIMLPVLAVVAGEVGRLMFHHEWIGGAVFCVALAAAVWVRRFGTLAARLGTLVTLPFIALLVVPVPIDSSTANTLWPAVFGLVAFVWVAAAFLVAWRVGFLPAPRLEPAGRAVRPAPGRLPASTRMALHLLVGLGSCYALGRWLFPDHWAWMLISCYVVMSGNRGRGDVVHKGLHRIVGALGGTVIATLVAGAVPAGSDWTVVALFGVMAVATWLRDAGYLWWAAGVTAMLALLHGYYGVTGGLGHRLAAVALGSVIAVAISWFLLPVRSRDVFRRRWADALAALSADLTALREGQAPSALTPALRELELLEPTYLLHRRVTRRAGPADLVAALRRVHLALEQVEETPAPVLVGWARQVGAIRRRMRGEDSAPIEVATEAPTAQALSAALATLDREFSGEMWRKLGGDPDATKRASVAS